MFMSHFGTDGIRGRFGVAPITPEFALHLGYAAGRVLSARGSNPLVVIGKDTRLSGYVLEAALQSIKCCWCRCSIARSSANACDCAHDARVSCRCGGCDFGLA